MSFVLVVEPEVRFAERIEEVLGAQGWQTRVVASPSEALGVAAAQAPTLVIVNAELKDAGDLFRSFARRHGGPGALALLPEARVKSIDPHSVGADALLGKPFTPQDLVFAVRSSLAADRGSRPASDGDRLSSEDIFGDVLAEIEDGPPASSPAPQRPATPTGDIGKRLEQTLAGVLPESRRAPKPAARSSSSEVDALLDKTLSDLKMSGHSSTGSAPGRSPRSAPRPVATTRPPAPGAGADFGQYTLEERIAVGGMAEVWKARMKGFEGFQKTVAIKKILHHLTASEDFVTMFIDEAKLAAQLNHNNIIQIYDLGKADNEFYIAMEYVEGRDLRAVLRTARRLGAPMPEPLALLVAGRLADALDYAHRKRDFDNRDLGLVHRDISPQNVLISDEGEIKLCDFGIAKAVSKVGQTQMGALKGKIQYMSPEQAWGREVDARSDIFSLGSLVFEMLTGQPLFEGETEVSVLEAVRECRLRDPRSLNSSISDGASRMLEKALRKDPAARYSSAREMLEDISSMLLAMDHAASRVDLARWIDRLFRLAASEEPLPAAAPGAAAEAVSGRQTTGGATEASAPGTAGGVSAAPPEPKTDDGTGAQPAGAVRSAPPRALPPVEMLAPEEVEALSPLAGAEPSSGSEEAGRGRILVLAGAGAAVVVAAVVSYFVFWPREPAARTLPPVVEEAVPSPAGGVAGEAPLGASPGVEPEAQAGTVVEPLPGTDDLTAAQAEPDSGDRVEAPDLLPPPVPQEPATSQAAPSRAEPRVPAQESPENQVGGGRETSAAAPAPARSEPEPAVDRAEAASSGSAVQPAAPPGGGRAGAGESSASTEGVPREPTASPSPISTAVAQAETEGQPQGGGPAEERPAEPAGEPATEVGDLVEPGAGVVPPVLVSFEKPQYPPMARRMGVQGTVVVSVLVDEEGRPVEWKLIKEISQRVGMNEAVIEAVKKARWEPATKDGIRVRMWTSVVVPFKI